ncbi:hypothetical protein RRG08_024298 [Elysia crispata]|uniref:Uncharacterized protein n=1 Tax=Elysia crispata TaxID=231223 RepID=A0AAE1DSW2_9GAST|nr:hypothetical protein RRG08_024298 [Elysia crispata]
MFAYNKVENFVTKKRKATNVRADIYSRRLEASQQCVSGPAANEVKLPSICLSSLLVSNTLIGNSDLKNMTEKQNPSAQSDTREKDGCQTGRLGEGVASADIDLNPDLTGPERTDNEPITWLLRARTESIPQTQIKSIPQTRTESIQKTRIESFSKTRIGATCPAHTESGIDCPHWEVTGQEE